MYPRTPALVVVIDGTVPAVLVSASLVTPGDVVFVLAIVCFMESWRPAEISLSSPAKRATCYRCDVDSDVCEQGR